MELSGEKESECEDREKYVLPDDKMKNCDIDKCDINGKTLGEFKSLLFPESSGIRCSHQTGKMSFVFAAYTTSLIIL